MTIPESHKTERIDLPPVSAVVDTGDDNERVIDTNDALSEWFESTSNFLVMMGSFGAGKTYAVVEFQRAHENIEYVEFDKILSVLNEYSESILSTVRFKQGTIVVIDNFDSVNTLTGLQATNPDLRMLRHVLSDHRVVVLTRRTRAAIADEMMSQLRFPQRRADLNIWNPFVIELQPWDINYLKNFAEMNSNRDLLRVCDFIDKSKIAHKEHFARPLIIRMLIELGETLNAAGSNPSLGDVYKLYIETVLSKDYDAGRSLISFSKKRIILQKIAYDIFLGLESGDSASTAPLTISYERLSERILEYALDRFTGRQYHALGEYDWTEDFTSTNHIMDKYVPSIALQHPELTPLLNRSNFHFIHESFYEFFLGTEIANRILNNHSLELNPEKLSVANVESLAFAFAKEFGGSELRQATKSLLARPRLTVVDRLVLLYFIEDDYDFANIIQSLPDNYFTDLEDIESETESFFLKKMIRYQLVIKGRYDASDYVREVMQHEDDLAIEAERRLHSAEREVTLQLLERLRNPALERARLITIYRLGQLGDETAIEPLSYLAADTRFAIEANNAIQRIRERGTK